MGIFGLFLKLLGLAIVLILLINFICLIKYGKPFVKFNFEFEDIGDEEEDEGEEDLLPRKKVYLKKGVFIEK